MSAGKKSTKGEKRMFKETVRTAKAKDTYNFAKSTISDPLSEVNLSDANPELIKIFAKNLDKMGVFQEDIPQAKSYSFNELIHNGFKLFPDLSHEEYYNQIFVTQKEHTKIMQYWEGKYDEMHELNNGLNATCENLTSQIRNLKFNICDEQDISQNNISKCSNRIEELKNGLKKADEIMQKFRDENEKLKKENIDLKLQFSLLLRADAEKLNELNKLKGIPFRVKFLEKKE